MNLSWVELYDEYTMSIKQLQLYKGSIKGVKESKAIADREILSNMINEGEEINQIVKQKALYEFGSLSEKELSVLTDRQKEVATLRQFHTYSEISKITDLPQTSVFELFQQAVKRVRKEKRKQCENGDIEIPSGLSKQQEKIYLLHTTGKKPKEISEILNTSPGNVRKQLVIIKQKRYQNPENSGKETMRLELDQHKEATVN